MSKTGRYGLEVFLYSKFNDKPHKVVPFKKARHLVKLDKFSVGSALVSYISEGASIFWQLVRIKLILGK